jgi:NMD protein affecting ribosome stability and mRNA decay
MDLLKNYNLVHMTVCPKCRKVKKKNLWIKEPDLGQAITKEVIHNLWFNREPEEIDIDIPDLDYIPSKLEIKAELTEGETVEPHMLEVEIKKDLCTTCNLANGRYYEGILQLRGKDITQALALVKSSLQEGVFINKIVEHKQGVDLYLTSKNFLHKISKILNDNFGGEVLFSKRIFSRDKMTSKDIWRVSVLFRLWDFGLGDIILVNDKLVRVEKCLDGKVLGFDLRNEKHVNLKPEGTVEIVAQRKNLKEAMIISEKPCLTVLNPENYQPVEVTDCSYTKRPKVLEYEGKFYMV